MFVFYSYNIATEKALSPFLILLCQHQAAPFHITPHCLKHDVNSYAGELTKN